MAKTAGPVEPKLAIGDGSDQSEVKKVAVKKVINWKSRLNVLINRRWKAPDHAHQLTIYHSLPETSAESFRARVVLVPLQREFEGGERANKKDAEDAAAEIAAIFLERQLQGRHKHKTDLEIACASPCSPAPIVQTSAAVPSVLVSVSAPSSSTCEPLEEPPSRTDNKSWISALREHMVAQHGQAAGEQMWESEKLQVAEQKFRARILIKPVGSGEARSLPWSGDVVGKKKAEQVAAYLALTLLLAETRIGASGAAAL